MDLRTHVTQLSQLHQIKLGFIGEQMSRRDFELYCWDACQSVEKLSLPVSVEDVIISWGMAFPDYREVYTLYNPSKSEQLDVRTYLTIMHEMGHIIHPEGNNLIVDQSVNDIIQCELAAWEWAVENILPEALTQTTLPIVTSALEMYCRGRKINAPNQQRWVALQTQLMGKVN